ncbi:macoilin-like, partial [Pollicipes pollicipes]|uniref:macoilin-like n=1 Tax=Pollicipes pollicipes TaxID=41117 RepID=UPI0018852527
SINEFDESEDKEKNYKNCSQTQRSSKWTSSSCSSKEKKSRAKEAPVAAVTSGPPPKDENVTKLELDVKRLRADLNSSRQTEQELRSQVSNLVIQERNARNQLQLLQLDNDSLQSKLHNLVTCRQQDKQTVVTLEKKVAEERKLRQGLESQLQQEKKKVAQAAEQAPRCTEQCKARRRDLEAETRQLRRENKQYEDRVRSAERELQVSEVGLAAAGRASRDQGLQSDSEVLMSALSAMQEKNPVPGEEPLLETRLKMDLFAALAQLSAKDREISDLHAKLADVLSVMPGLSSAGVSGDHNGYGGIEPYPGANSDPLRPQDDGRATQETGAAGFVF